MSGSKECLQLILTHFQEQKYNFKKFVNLPDWNGNTPLHWCKNSLLLPLLLQTGANPNLVESCYHNSPLHKAAYERETSDTITTTTILLSHGASLDVVDKNHCTALQIAIQRRHWSVALRILAVLIVTKKGVATPGRLVSLSDGVWTIGTGTAPAAESAPADAAAVAAVEGDAAPVPAAAPVLNGPTFTAKEELFHALIKREPSSEVIIFSSGDTVLAVFAPILQVHEGPVIIRDAIKVKIDSYFVSNDLVSPAIKTGDQVIVALVKDRYKDAIIVLPKVDDMDAITELFAATAIEEEKPAAIYRRPEPSAVKGPSPTKGASGESSNWRTHTHSEPKPSGTGGRGAGAGRESGRGDGRGRGGAGPSAPAGGRGGATGRSTGRGW